MLESIRRGAQSFGAKLLFALLVFSFAIWGVADVFTGWGRGAIATVGGSKITAEEFQRSFQNELERISRSADQRINAEQARALGFDRRVLQQLIGSTAIETHAEQLGLAISEKSLVEGLQSDPNFQGADGKFSADGLRAMLRQIGLTEGQFLSLRRKDELRELIIAAMVNAQTIPKPMLDMEHNYNQEKRVVEWLRIDPDEAVKVTEPDEAKLKELYEANKAKYMTPEYRKLQVLLLTVDDLKSTVQVSDDEIKTKYEEDTDSYDTPEMRRVQQIAFKDKAAAEAALKALRDGSKTFGDVAKEAGAKDTDVDLGLVTKKALIDPKIADAAFALEKDKFSDVVEGRFATVVLRVTQIQPGVKRTLADVKDQVKDKIATTKARAELQTKHDEVDDNRAAGKTLQEIASTMKLTFKDIAAADSKGLGPDGKPVLETPDFAKIVSAGFSPDAGSDAPPVELANDGYAWVHLVSSEQPKQKTFDQVKEEVKGAYMAAEHKKLVGELAKKLSDRVNAGEPMTALEDAAKTKVQTTEKITRATQPQGLSDAAVAQAFALAKGRSGYAPHSDKTTDVVIRVVDIIPAAAPTLTETDTLNRKLVGDLAAQTLAEYTEGLKTRLGASVNEKEFGALFGSQGQ